MIIRLFITAFFLGFNFETYGMQNFVAKFSHDIPLHIKQDIEAISSRTNTFSFTHVRSGLAFSVTNILAREKSKLQIQETLLNINNHAWTKSRFRDVLPSIVHEFGHIQLKHYSEDSTKLHQQEYEADAQFAIKTGIAHDAALVYWRDNCLSGITHPSSDDRAVRLFKLHQKNLLNPEYLDGRFWKLGFILQSYKNQILSCNQYCGAFQDECLKSNGYWCKRLMQKKDQLFSRTKTIQLLKKLINHKSKITKYLQDNVDNDLEEHYATNDVIIFKMPVYDYILFDQELVACN